MRIFTLFFLLLLSLKSYGDFSSWDVNDVSYLFPLPQASETDFLLQPRDQHHRGEILPASWVDQMPPLLMLKMKIDIKELLRTVAVRIDPCFPGQPTPLKCEAQIRLVWQPVERSKAGAMLAYDAALHSFYHLSSQEFQALLLDLQNLRTKHNVQTSGLPLGVHPGLTQESFRSEFKNLVLNYIGESNLTKVTTMVLRGGGDMWAFISFVKNEQGVPIPEEIPRTRRNKVQSFFNSALPAVNFVGAQIAPVPDGSDTFNKILTAKLDPEKDQSLLHEEIQAIYKIENPQRHNPDTSDCVSCHTAMSARIWAQGQKGDWDFNKMFQSERYQNLRYNLSNVSKTSSSTQLLRAFGYDLGEAAIAQRTINESAEVVDYIKSMTTPH